MKNYPSAQPRITWMVLTISAATLVAAVLSAQGPRPNDIVNGHETAPNEVLVKFTRPQTPAERAQTGAIVDADRDEDITPGGVRRIHSRRFDATALVNYFLGAPSVDYAEPNYLVYAIATPNDPSFGNLWGLLNTGQVVNSQAGTPGADIDTTPAWDITTGSIANVVGVVDTGVDYNHEDLAANIWSAPSSFTVTVAGKNVTCAAGTHGFRSTSNFPFSSVMSCDPLDDNNHGSHVSGTIGAVGNNTVGVAGVNWTASIMGLKFLNSSGSGTTADAVNVIEFAIQAKSRFGASANVRVLSNSWGGGGFSQTLLDEINKANTNGMLFVAAAGNNNSNNDTTAFYPANYNAPNVVAVAATDNTDAKASFSNYGASTVDLGAPGVDILSTTRNNTYSYFSGTSMATPHVSGAAALILSACGLNTADLKTTILNTVDVIPSMIGITVTNGRLNVNNALQSCAGPPPPPGPPAAPTGLTATGGNNQVTLNWNASSGATGYNIYRSTSPNGEVAPPVNLSPVANPNYTDTSVTNGVTYYYKVTALNTNGQSGFSGEASATPSAPSAPAAPTNVSASTGPGKGRISLSWTGSASATSYNVKRSSSSGGPYSLVATTSNTSYRDTGLTSGLTYYFVVTAVNASGESPNSNEASARAQ